MLRTEKPRTFPAPLHPAYVAAFGDALALRTLHDNTDRWWKGHNKLDCAICTTLDPRLLAMRYIGARRKEGEPRWFALLNAALNQPNPSEELTAAINGLKKQTRGRTYEEREATHGAQTAGR